MVLLLVVALSLTGISCVQGMDSSRFKEDIGCGDISPEVDFNWLMTIGKWYFPLWSQLYRLRVASDLLEKPISAMSEYELSNSCTIFDGTTFKGYGRELTYDVEPLPAGNGITFKAKWKGAIKGTFKYQFTDNKSFVLAVVCWEDGETGWAVMSTNPKLDKKTEERIRMHITSLGFNKDFIVEENYAGCPDNISKKSEL